MSSLEIRPGRTINIEIYKNPNSLATLFLVHGIGGSGAQWREQIKILQKDYTLIVPDLLGHGKSEKPNPTDVNPYTFKAFAEDLEIIFNKYATEKNFLLGHSYGGALALFLAVQHSEKINKLVLIAPAPCEPFITIPFIFKLPVFLLNLLQPLLDKSFQKLAFDNSVDAKLKREESEAGLKNAMTVIKAMWQGCTQVEKINPKQVSTPTLVIVGESDKIIPAPTIKNYYEHIPHLQFEVIQKAGHMVMLEQHEKINSLIIQFLKK